MWKHILSMGILRYDTDVFHGHAVTRNARDRPKMSRRVRSLMIVLLITVLAHICIYLSADVQEPCEPRVLVRREFVTETPQTPKPPPPPPPQPKPPEDTKKSQDPEPQQKEKQPQQQQQPPQQQQKEACVCDDSQSGLRGHGTLYQDIKPTKFNAKEKKKLFILGYQRVGSSFFGQLFDENPNFFYIYEPLDAIYTEMYGTRGGLNVPSDITYHANGTARRLTQEENTKILQLLTDILDCNVDKLPRGFMLHRFWDFLVESYMPSWAPYRTCLEETNILKAREECRDTHLGALCPSRLGLNTTDQAHCKKLFYDLEKYGRHNGPKIQPFIKYEDCLIEAYNKGKKCFDLFKDKCSKSHLWATKTVRGTMEHAEKLMANNPNMRLIHLIRDPRPVVTSRSMANSYRGIFSGVETIQGGNKPKEAVVYCGTVVRDIKYRRDILEKRFPGQIIQVIYEDFVQNPAEYAKAIYAFLDEKIPDELVPWIKTQTEGGKWKNNAMVRMNGWKNGMTFKEGEQVQQNCKQFYELVPYQWPY